MNNSTNISKKDPNEFDFLVKLAINLGAVEAKVIPANDIVVENRVLLKCLAGCPSYRKKLTCPPFVPTVEEFRKMLKEYRAALLVKFDAKIETDDEVGRSLLRHKFDESAPKKLKEKAIKFLSDWDKEKHRINLAMLELEKTAFNQGYTFALGFRSGSCSLCKECNIKEGICLHPSMSRYPEHAVGVNIKKTIENAGMTISFPFQNKPDPIVLLLID